MIMLCTYSLLPMSVLNETGVKVKIRHSESIHSGECESSEGNCAVSTNYIISLVLLRNSYI
jgi:hypothetical protein